MSADYERNFRAELESGQCKPNHGCNVASACMCVLAEEAIDENDLLRARVAELEKALKPFVDLADHAEKVVGLTNDRSVLYVHLGPCRRARAVLK